MKKKAAGKSTAKKSTTKKKTAKKSATKKATAKKSTTKKTVTKKATRKKTTKKSSSAKAPAAKPSMRSEEAREVAGTIARLAFERHQQDGRLKVRQREQLRRALVAAAGVMGWEKNPVGNDDPVDLAARDMLKLARLGAKNMAQDMADSIARKKAEAKELKKVAKELLKLAKDKKTEYPVQMTYEYTAKGPTRGLVTKEAELELEAPSDAEDAAATIEKKLERWTDLKDQMAGEMKQTAGQIDEMAKGLPEFVDASRVLIGEVFAILT